MTKEELITELEDLPDDTRIYVPSMEGSDVFAWFPEVECDGSNGDKSEVAIAVLD